MKVLVKLTDSYQEIKLPVPITCSKIRLIQAAIYNSNISLSDGHLFVSLDNFDSSIMTTKNLGYLCALSPTVQNSWYLYSRDLETWDTIFPQRLINSFNIRVFWSNFYGTVALSPNIVSLEFEFE